MSEVYHVVAFRRGVNVTPTIQILSSHHNLFSALDACPKDERKFSSTHPKDERKYKWSEYIDYRIIKNGEELDLRLFS